MKNLIIVLFMVSVAFQIEAQPTENVLTPTQFENIKINNVTLRQIWDTNGTQLNIQNLLGSSYQYELWDNTPGSSSFTFDFNSFQLDFSQLDNSEMELSGFEIADSSISITINGRTAKIGDHFLKLGSTLKNTMTTGGKSILFVPSNDETVYLSIRYNQSTGIITKIIYYVLT